MIVVAGAPVTLSLPDAPGGSSALAAYHFVIMRLGVSAPDIAGTVGPDGTYLHLSQEPPFGVELTTQDTTNLLNEWDPDGTMVFHRCPKLNLVGGLGRYGVSVRECRLPSDGYQVRARKLRRVIEAGAPFVVPPGHTGIGSLNQVAPLLNVDENVPLVLSSSVAYPIASGTTVGIDPASGLRSVILFTSYEI